MIPDNAVDSLFVEYRIRELGRFRQGDVVRSRSTGERHIVLNVYRPGDTVSNGLPIAAGDLELKTPYGVRVTNRYSDLEVIPWEECTTEERVRSTLITWKPSFDDMGDDRPEDDTLAWHLIYALAGFTEKDMDDQEWDWEWPGSIVGVALRAAEKMDAAAGDADPYGVN